MLLEMTQSEIVGLLQDGAQLKLKVEEAVKVLSDHKSEAVETAE